MNTNLILSILTLSFFLASCSSVYKGRPESVAVEYVNYDILYAGYPNKVRLAVFGHKSEDIYLQGRGLSILKTEEENTYILKTSYLKKQAFLDVFVVKKKDTTLLRTVDYYCYPLPDPDLYWGSKLEGSVADIKSKWILARYSDFLFPITISITKWEMKAGSVQLKSNGPSTRRAEKALNKLKEPTKIYFKVYYKIMGGDEGVKEVFWKFVPAE